MSPFLVTAANERSPGFSPDGNWIVYASDESGQDEIYVRPYPTGDGKWTVSRDGGREPVWSRNGREIYYRRQDQVLAVPVLQGSGLRVGEPVVLFGGRADAYDGPNGSRSFDVTADGQRFLFVRLGQETANLQYTVVVNWAAEVKR